MDKAQGPILQLTELFSSPAAAPGARPVLSLLPVSKETFKSMMITKWSFCASFWDLICLNRVKLGTAISLE